MSDENDSVAADVDDSNDFQPITTQDALDKIIGQRIDRVKKQYTGFDELKAKADQFDEFQEASKTELQRVQERAQQLEVELTSERSKALVESVAAAKDVPAAGLTGSNREELEASADALIEWRGKPEKVKAKPARGLKSGVTGSDSLADPKEVAAAAIRAMRANP